MSHMGQKKSILGAIASHFENNDVRLPDVEGRLRFGIANKKNGFFVWHSAQLALPLHRFLNDVRGVAQSG